MSVATVKTHVSRILAKLDLNNRVQIALLAYDAGLLEDDQDPARTGTRQRPRTLTVWKGELSWLKK